MTVQAVVGPVPGYRPPDDATDELTGPDGRPHRRWEPLARALGALEVEELAHRRAEAARLLEDDGVTYQISGEGLRGHHGWDLDPVPLILDQAEWAAVERGVSQRVELLNLVLTDIYGPRDLLRRGLVPPEAVFGHAGFLRECDGIRLPGPRQLFTCAVDLGRDSTGQWRAVTDRAQSPSGAGYALENRVVVSRILPSLYRDAGVRRLAPFFRAMRSSLLAVAPHGSTGNGSTGNGSTSKRSSGNGSTANAYAGEGSAGDGNGDSPRIVVLTPGPYSPTAFEHAFLAMQLGYPLVEGSDLVVEGGRLWLRALGRRERVDVVLRRVDSTFCDPLEFRAESELGVPGLVEACRAGTVSVVNTLGSGVLENPVLASMLPRLSQALIGEPLLLPPPETWWCADPTARSHVLSRLDRLVLKPLAPGSRGSLLGWTLSSQELDRLRGQISDEPYSWVGQEPLPLSTAPTLTGTGLEPRRVMLRTFAVARGDGYLVMTGGLARVAPAAGSIDVSSSSRALTKDVWVTADEPERLSGFWLQPGPAVAALPPTSAISARVAEDLFWLGRYAERAEGTARLLRVVGDRAREFPSVMAGPDPAPSDSTGPGTTGADGPETATAEAEAEEPATAPGTECLRTLLGALTVVTTTYPGFAGPGSDARLAAPEAELLSLVTDAGRAGTLAHAVRRLFDAAYAVRDQLSYDTWLVVGHLERKVGQLASDAGEVETEVQVVLGEIMQGLLALSGLAAESMIRDPGWHFMDAGRRIERSAVLVDLLRATLGRGHSSAADSLLVESLLISSESIITYRRRYRSRAQVPTVLDLLVTDRENPRSLAWQADRLAEDLRRVPGGGGSGLELPERMVLDLVTRLETVDTTELATLDSTGRRPHLEEFLGETAERLRRLSGAVADLHFTHQTPQRPMAAAAWRQAV